MNMEVLSCPEIRGSLVPTKALLEYSNMQDTGIGVNFSISFLKITSDV